jgi:hypothetical protein
MLRSEAYLLSLASVSLSLSMDHHACINTHDALFCLLRLSPYLSCFAPVSLLLPDCLSGYLSVCLCCLLGHMKKKEKTKKKKNTCITVRYTIVYILL